MIAGSPRGGSTGSPRWVRNVALGDRPRDDRADPARRHHGAARPQSDRGDVALPARARRPRAAPSSSRSRRGATRAGSRHRPGPHWLRTSSRGRASPRARRSSSPGRSRRRPARIRAARTSERLGLGDHRHRLRARARDRGRSGSASSSSAVFLWRLRRELPGIAAALGRRCSSCSSSQMIVGEVQYRNALPWWLVAHPRLARGDDLGADGRDRVRPLHRPPARRLSPAGVDRRSAAKLRRWSSRPPDRRAADVAPPRPDRRIPRLERRRPGRDARGRHAGARLGRAHASPTSIPRAFVDFQATRPTVSLDEGLTRRIEWPETTFYAAAHPGRRSRRRDPARRRAELPLARVQRPRRSASRATSASSSSSRSARCSPTCRTRGPRRSRARRATSRSSRSSGCRRRATRARRASSACCTTPSARRASRRSASGRRCRTTSRSRRAPAPRGRSATGSASCSRSTIDLHRARGGGGDLRRADHRGRRLRSRDAGVRRGARAAGRHDRRADRRDATCRRASHSPPS